MAPKKKQSFGSFLFKLMTAPAPAPSWPWPSCKQPRTDSFRVVEVGTAAVNPVYFESAGSSFRTPSSSSSSSSSEEERSGDRSPERVVRGLRSADRLFFRRPGDTSSILEEAKPFEDSVVMAVESEDPYRDFRRSMEEMVAAHGLRDWRRLETLLRWYLRVNGKKTHGFILGAFADLLVGLAPSSSSSASSASSSSTSFEIMEIKEEDDEGCSEADDCLTN